VRQPEGHGRILARRRFFALDVAHGFIAFWRGALILFRPEFAGRLTGPILANIAVFLVLGIGMFLGFQAFFDWLASGDWGWFESVRDGGSWVFSILLTLVSMLLLAPALIEAVVAPFLDPLVDAAERRMCGPGFESLHVGTWRSAWIGVRSSAQTLLISLILLVPGWLLAALVPGGFVFMTLCSAVLTAVVWFEIPFARRGYGLRRRIAVLRYNWARTLGFGMAFQVGMGVPLFNLVLLTPAAAMGVTLLYFHFEKDPLRFEKAAKSP